MALHQFFDREPGLVALDVGETLALLLLPAVVVGLGLALVGGTTGFLTGLFVGGLLGAVLARGRWTLRAVRTENGIERATYLPYSLDPEERTEFEYDEKYDRPLVVVLAAVGAGSFVAVASGVVPEEWSLWVVVVGTLSSTAALMTIGLLHE